METLIAQNQSTYSLFEKIEAGARHFTILAEMDEEMPHTLQDFTDDPMVAASFFNLVVSNHVSPCHLQDIWEDNQMQ